MGKSGGEKSRTSFGAPMEVALVHLPLPPVCCTCVVSAASECVEGNPTKSIKSAHTNPTGGPLCKTTIIGTKQTMHKEKKPL